MDIGTSQWTHIYNVLDLEMFNIKLYVPTVGCWRERHLASKKPILGI